MRAGDYYRVEVDSIYPRQAGTGMNVNETIITAAGGVTGYFIANKLRKKRVEAREKERIGDEVGHWVRIKDPINAVVFQRRWDSFQNALLLHEKVAHDLLEMEVEQFRETYEIERPPADPQSGHDVWDGVTWSSDET